MKTTKNDTKTYFNFFEEIFESSICIEYSMLIGKDSRNVDIEIPKKPEQVTHDIATNIVESVFEDTYKDLHFIYDNFHCFGKEGKFVPKFKVKVAESVQELRERAIKPTPQLKGKAIKSPPKHNPKDFSGLDYDMSFWKFIIKQHMVLDSYAKIRKTISDKNVLKVADYCKANISVRKDSRFHPNHRYGLYYLLSNKNSSGITLSDQCKLKLPLYKYDESLYQDNLKYSNKKHQNNTAKKLETILKHLISVKNGILPLTGIMDIFDWKTEDKNMKPKDLVNANALEVLNVLMGWEDENTPLSSISNIHKTDELTIEAYKNYRKSYNQIMDTLSGRRTIPLHKAEKARYLDAEGSEYENIKFIEDKSFVVKFTEADKLYCKYVLEKMFSFDVVDCLYQNILSKEDSEYYMNNMDVLAACYLLPNILGRKYLIQMAFDNEKYPLQNETFIKEGSVFRMRFHYDKIKRKTVWLDKCIGMVNSLSKFVLPLSQNHFMNTLWYRVRAKTKTDEECLKFIFYIISEYLNDADTVCKLLNAEESIQIKDYNWNKLVQPFKYKEDINLNVYKKCLKPSNDLSKEAEAIPSVITTEYMRRFTELETNVKACYRNAGHHCNIEPASVEKK